MTSQRHLPVMWLRISTKFKCHIAPIGLDGFSVTRSPGPGRFRQFMQFDADTVGAPGVQADAEMCMMMADVMEALGIKRGDYVIRVNSRKILDAVLEQVGLLEDGMEDQRVSTLRAMDALDRLGIEGVKERLGKGREDESGDWTPGVGLTENQIAYIEAFLLPEAWATPNGYESFFTTSRDMISSDDGEKKPSGLAEQAGFRT